MNKEVCPVRNVKVVQIIEVTFLRGSGKNEDDPLRRVTQYWSFEGTFLAEFDPMTSRQP